MREVGQVTEFGRYRPSETVAMEVQLPEVGQITEFGWYRPSKIFAPEVQLPEFRQVTEFGRQPAVQSNSRVKKAVEEDRRDAQRGST